MDLNPVSSEVSIVKLKERSGRQIRQRNSAVENVVIEAYHVEDLIASVSTLHATVSFYC